MLSLTQSSKKEAKLCQGFNCAFSSIETEKEDSIPPSGASSTSGSSSSSTRKDKEQDKQYQNTKGERHRHRHRRNRRNLLTHEDGKGGGSPNGKRLTDPASRDPSRRKGRRPKNTQPVIDRNKTPEDFGQKSGQNEGNVVVVSGAKSKNGIGATTTGDSASSSTNHGNKAILGDTIDKNAQLDKYTSSSKDKDVATATDNGIMTTNTNTNTNANEKVNKHWNNPFAGNHTARAQEEGGNYQLGADGGLKLNPSFNTHKIDGGVAVLDKNSASSRYVGKEVHTSTGRLISS